MSVENITSICLFSAIGIFIALERLFPYTKGKKFFREGFWIDFVWYTVIQSYFLKILIFDYIIAPAKSGLGLSEMGYLSHWPIWALALFFLVTHDFYIYWFHRLQHNSRLFWRTHEAHHSVITCDWLAGSRSHIVEIIINQTIEFAPIFFLLDAKTAAIVVPIKALMDAVWGMFIHSNIDVRLGKLQYFINGPEMHQWHHADDRRVFYANYATKFAVFDWVFGTAYLPTLHKTKYEPKAKIIDTSHNDEYPKPTKFGLPYDYPKDYFMQHVFSFWRYNVKKLEAQKWYHDYDNMRVYFLNWCSNLLGLKVHLPDENPLVKAVPLPAGEVDEVEEMEELATAQ